MLRKSIWFNEVKRGIFSIETIFTNPFHISRISQEIHLLTGILPINQSFYYKGSRKHIINPTISDPLNYYSILDDCDTPKIFLVFLFFIRGEKNRVEVPMQDKKENTIYDALKILSYDYRYTSLFQTEFKMLVFNKKVLFNTKIKDLEGLKTQENEIVVEIKQKTLKNPVFLSFCRNDQDPYAEDNLSEFRFRQKSKIELVKRFLELYYKAGKDTVEIIKELEIDENLTIEEAGLDEEEVLKVLVEYEKDLGGHSLQLPNLTELGQLEHNENAPKHRIVKKGHSWKCKCLNPQCFIQQNNEFIIVNQGFGVFDVSRTVLALKCPNCQQKAAPTTCGFYKAYVRIYGMKKENDEKVDQSYNFDVDLYSYFEDSVQIEWHYLNIQAKPLD